jgi:hypothetical protein
MDLSLSTLYVYGRAYEPSRLLIEVNEPDRSAPFVCGHGSICVEPRAALRIQADLRRQFAGRSICDESNVSLQIRPIDTVT